MAAHSRGGVVRALCLVLLVVTVAGCLPSPTVAPTTTSGTLPTPGPSGAGVPTLRFAISAEPTLFSPAAADEPTRLVNAFLFAGLYRLDARGAAQPDLAEAVPAVSADGRTWTVRLRAGTSFSDGSPLTASDVARTYQLALSAACPFADLCRPAADALASVTVRDPRTVAFGLRQPWAPLLTEVLARLGIVSAPALDASLARLLQAAAGADAAAIGQLADSIAAATNADACFVDQPPATCELATYQPQLEATLRSAGVPLPDAAHLLGSDGRPDPVAYAAALLARVSALDEMLGASGVDRLAAAFPLLDAQRAPVASGPFRLAAYEPGAAVELSRWQAGAPGLPQRVHVAILPDPAVAVTALESGELDWLPEVSADLVPALQATAGLHVAARSSGTLRAIVFNQRPGRLYADQATRAAFAACLDRPADWNAATAGLGLVATGLLVPGSWAAAPATWPVHDPAEARRLLASAGWTAGPDGIMARGGQRLASTVYVRPSRADLRAFFALAADQLRACGIALDVVALGLAGDVLLAQLEYPNSFDTYLAALDVGGDPDAALGRFHSRHVTTAANPADANFGGVADPVLDAALDRGAAATGQAERLAAYQAAQARLAEALPLVPLGWDVAWAAVADRVTVAGRAVDPAAAGYAADVLAWRVPTP